MPILRPIRGTQLNLTHPLSRGLVGCWFADGSNSAFDYSRNGNNGTFAGDTYCVSGKFGYAWSFDGNGDYIRVLSPVANLPIGASDRTVTAWIYPLSEGLGTPRNITCYGVWAKGKAFEFSIDDTNALRVQFHTYNFQSTVHIIQDSWNYVGCIIKNGVNVTVFVNDTFESSTLGASINTTASALDIGARIIVSPIYMNGLIDGVRIYNRALTPEEIRQLYIDSFCMFEDDSKISKKFL